MTQPINYERRKARGGRGLLPPNKEQWNPEHHALDLREDLNLPLLAPLDPLAAFALLDQVTVHPHGAIPAAACHLDTFRNAGSSSWSGMALRLPDGHELVFYNDCHPPTRVRATLMEEFFHLWLGHPRSQIRLIGEGADTGRSYDATVEYEAFSSGAAALVPFKALTELIGRGDTMRGIAKHFGVSPDLVAFRMKVTKRWRQYHSKRRPRR